MDEQWTLLTHPSIAPGRIQSPDGDEFLVYGAERLVALLNQGRKRALADHFSLVLREFIHSVETGDSFIEDYDPAMLATLRGYMERVEKHGS